MLRPLWLLLPFSPFLALLFNLSILFYTGIVFVLFIYFFPVLVVIYACLVFTLLPDSFDPLLKTCAGMMMIGYCGIIAYYIDQKMRVKKTQLTTAKTATIYGVTISILGIILLTAAGFPASSEMPIYELKDQQQWIENIKSYRDDYGFIDKQFFIRTAYKKGFIEHCVNTFNLKPYQINEIPKPFWNKFIIWWHPRLTDNARAYCSENFDFYKRGEDGDHFFFFDMPSEQVCYIWFKNNF